MPNALIATFTQTGTTTSIADQITQGLVAAGWQVNRYDIAAGTVKDRPKLNLDAYDLLGIGTPTYFFRPPFVVQEFMRKLPGLEGKAAFAFVLHGTHPGACGNQIRAQLRAKGAKDVGYFRCAGADYWVGYIKRGYLFSPDAPTDDDLSNARAFGDTVAQRCLAAPTSVEPYDSPTPVMYGLERALTIRPFARLMYSKTFSADRTCNACGLCIQKCPVGNITAKENGKPQWHSNCLLCATCELACPKDAIHSAFDWFIFAPFMVYNIQRARKAHPYARVEHSHGKTRRI